MTVNLFGLLAIIAFSVLLSLLCVTLGAWVMFKGKAGPGEGFIKAPKGEVFNITDAELVDNALDTTKGQEQVLKNTERFLSSFLKEGA